MGYTHEITRFAGCAAESTAIKKIQPGGLAAASEYTSCEGIKNCWIVWSSLEDFLKDTYPPSNSTHYEWVIQFHENVWIEEASKRICVGQPNNHDWCTIEDRIAQLKAGVSIANLIRSGKTPAQAFEQWFEGWDGND